MTQVKYFGILVEAEGEGGRAMRGLESDDPVIGRSGDRGKNQTSPLMNTDNTDRKGGREILITDLHGEH
jgi:hypothetical protein